ncbi:MAG: hypothetical protein M3277_10570 [Actinomycetota bacterium]|nr:hypothetical protein [Actinomycetota bacterium]
MPGPADKEPTAEGDVTGRLDAVDEASDEPRTVEFDPPAPPVYEEPLDNFLGRVRAQGWLELVQAAGLSFLIAVTAGAVLVLAAKLNFPAFGSNGDVLGAINVVVMAGLAVLNVPIVFDGVALAALPLGALVLVLWVSVRWASSILRPAPDLRTAVLDGVRMAIPFALLCWFCALAFRFGGRHPVAADAGAALVIGTFWGGLIGVLAGVAGRMAPRRVWEEFRARTTATFGLPRAALAAGAVMVGALAALGLVATFLYFIVVLARDAPGRYFDAGDALAYVLYVVAFLPNIVLAAISVSVGAAIDVGARLTLGGEVVGPLREYSMWTWGRGDAPLALSLLLVIPLVAGAAGGVAARRIDDDMRSMAPALLIASASAATVVSLLAWIGRARFAGVVKGSGYGMIAPDVVGLFVLSFLLLGLAGALGWQLAPRLKR